MLRSVGLSPTTSTAGASRVVEARARCASSTSPRAARIECASDVARRNARVASCASASSSSASAFVGTRLNGVHHANAVVWEPVTARYQDRWIARAATRRWRAPPTRAVATDGEGVDARPSGAIPTPPPVAANAPRARYRARRPSRERRWERPVDTWSAPATRGKKKFLSWAELRRLRAQTELKMQSQRLRGPNGDAAPMKRVDGAPPSSSSSVADQILFGGDLSELDFDFVPGGAERSTDDDFVPGSSSSDKPPKTYRGKALVKRIKQLGDARRLDDVLALVERSEIPTTRNGRRITVGAVIGACCKCGDLDRGLTLLRQLDGPGGIGAGAPSYCALIQAHGRAGRLREALLLLETWEKGRGPKDSKIGVGRNGTIYVAAAGKWQKKDVPLRSEKWRDEMGTEWHPPRVAQTRMLLTIQDACASCGDVVRARFFKDRVLSWNGRIQNGRVAYDGVTDEEAAWNGVAKAHASSEDPLSCIAVLREMEEAGVTPSQCAYNIALAACQKGGRPDWARTLVARMRKVAARTGDANMYPDAMSYTTTARAEAGAARGFLGANHAGGVEAVEAMYAEVRGPLGPPPDPQCYGALVDAFVAYGAVDRALAALATAEREPGVDLTARAYLGVMRSQAARGDVRGVRRLAERMELELGRRKAEREARHARRNKKKKRGSAGLDVDASSLAYAAAMGAGAGPVNLGSSGGAAVEAEVVMCEAEAKAAAGDAAGARAALERLKSLDFASSSKVLRDRSTELLVSLFVKDVVGRGSAARSREDADFAQAGAAAAKSFLNEPRAPAAPGTARPTPTPVSDACVLQGEVDEVGVDGFLNCNADGDADADAAAATAAAEEKQKSMWGITQALDLIDSAWGFASLDEDDAFLPSLDEDDIPIPAAGGFGGFLNTAVKSTSDWSSPSTPVLRSNEAADALDLWAGAASRLFAGEAEPLIFRGGVDPGALLREVPDVGMTIDEGGDGDVDAAFGGKVLKDRRSPRRRGRMGTSVTENADADAAGESETRRREDDDEPPGAGGGGWFFSPVGGREAIRFVVRCDEPAEAAADAVGRGFVAVVIDENLRPVGTLRGSAKKAEGVGDTADASSATVRSVMGPPPTLVEGDTATIGDVAVLCAAAACDEPVAIVDAEGRLRRVLRQEDLLEPARTTDTFPR